MSQLRTYILIVGRDDNDRPHRELLPYAVPLPGLTDHYESLSNAQLKRLTGAIREQYDLLRGAAADLEAEAMARLENI